MTLAAFIIYLVLMIGIGIFCARYFTKTMKDFYLGGRKMNDWVVALSAVVSGRSAWLILGLSGIAFARGISAVWAVVGYVTVELFMFIFVGKRLRRYTQKVDAITLPDFYEARFRDKSHILRITSVVIIVVFMVFYIAAQFTAGAKTFCETFQIGNISSVLITAGIVLAYTVLGGFVAVSITDMLQAFFMLFGLVVLPIVAVITFGGFGKLYLTLVAVDGLPAIDPWALGLGGVIGYIGIGLGSPGNPHILVRYMSIERPQLLRKSALVGTIWNVVMAWGAILVGLVGRAYMGNKVPEGFDKETIFPFLAAEYMHPFVLGFMIASVFAAIMSTVDSQLLVASSGISRDIYQKVFRKGREISEKRMVLISRIVILLMVVVATLMACQYVNLTKEQKAQHIVYWIVLFAWGGMGASFGTTLLLALFWKGTTKWGVFAGLISGTVITIVWEVIPALNSLIYELIPAFGISFVLVIVVSLLTRPPEGAAEELSEIAAKYR